MGIYTIFLTIILCNVVIYPTFIMSVADKFTLDNYLHHVKESFVITGHLVLLVIIVVLLFSFSLTLDGNYDTVERVFNNLGVPI